jgi:hypothetical protein
MDELYSVDRVEYHRSEQRPPNSPLSMYDTLVTEIDDARFKELLVSMPDTDHIFHNNRSFKIAKDKDSLRISFFDFSKKSNHRREKHQLEKKLSIIRFIIKQQSDNFYVSIIRFGARKRVKDIKQNFIRHEHIRVFANKMTDLFIRNYKLLPDNYTMPEMPDDVKKMAIPQELSKEIHKISTILYSELGTTTTAKALTEPDTVGEIKEYFTELIAGVILEWFCRKNKIRVDYFWLTKLISTQYMTKRQLKKYDNNYLRAFLDYYKLTPAVVPHLKGMIKSYMDRTLDFTALSVYEKLFPIGEYEFNFESRIAKADDPNSTVSLLSVNPYLNNVYKLSDPRDREEFAKFLDYLYENRKAFHRYTVTNNALSLGTFIIALAKMHRMGVLFDFNYIPDIMHDPLKLRALTDAVIYLSDKSNSFVVQHYNKKYKEKVESTFTQYGIKWNVKLHTKPIVNNSGGYGDFISHNSSVILTEVKTGNFLEMNVVNPNAKKFISLIVSTDSLKEFLKGRGNTFYEQSSPIRELDIKNVFHHFSGKPKNIKRKAPIDSSAPIWAIHKVYNTFYENSRYFGVDNQILYPILDTVIRNNETLNKYTKTKPVTV